MSAEDVSLVPVTEWAPLVPELTVQNLTQSLDVYTRLFGFTLHYTRPGFAYLSLGRVQWMLEQAGPEAGWATGPLERPYGRGLNFQIVAPDLDALHARLQGAGYPLFRPLHTATYAEGETLHTVRQLLVQDPDGYLLRFTD
ncbi:bleomycin resistance protein [Deinococcus multiflagellatus]|uniref:Bleomycin resistance protein n=1 Tax=Deinococcus multiflagellatus TaxID=1656887 RepID=A0ABW1ZMR9_9DEIO|nr:VOC family protein [Deinococcus multiflagellatus]MBZ9715739.1 VOC family protein [Deinococcus multiflagellatus]